MRKQLVDILGEAEPQFVPLFPEVKDLPIDSIAMESA
jgi:hypothetical protein